MDTNNRNHLFAMANYTIYFSDEDSKKEGTTTNKQIKGGVAIII